MKITKILQKRTHFRENFLGNEDFRETFREISRKCAHFRIIFAKMENTVFVSTLMKL
jgi:hypothetical protein